MSFRYFPHLPILHVAPLLLAPLKQKSITDFFKQGPKSCEILPAKSISQPNITSKNNLEVSISAKQNTADTAPLLTKQGKIMKESHYTMKNISCRSSNLIYAITCKNVNSNM